MTGRSKTLPGRPRGERYELAQRDAIRPDTPWRHTMPSRHHPWTPLIAVLAAAAFVACEKAGPAGPDDEAVAFSHRDGHGGGKGGGGGDGGGDGGGGGGGGAPVVTLSGAAVGVHADKNIKETNRQVEISGGPQASTTFAFTGATNCVARHGSPDGEKVDDATAAWLTAWLTAKNVMSGLYMKYDKRRDNQPSDGHDLSFNFTDDSGRGVSIEIFAHGNPPPTIHRDGSTYTVSDGQVRVWLRDGPPKNHPKLFCTNNDSVVLTVN
jgi:hypothetical protein